MKMKYAVAISICVMLLAGCVRYHSERVRQGSTSVTIKETDDHYKLDAKFRRSNTDEVETVINQVLERNMMNDDDFDGTITLEDESRLYVRLRSGRLRIRFDKDENSEASYERVKRLGETIKIAITSNQVQLN